jgi:hypothetical protein
MSLLRGLEEYLFKGATRLVFAANSSTSEVQSGEKHVWGLVSKVAFLLIERTYFYGVFCASPAADEDCLGRVNLLKRGASESSLFPGERESEYGNWASLDHF